MHEHCEGRDVRLFLRLGIAAPAVAAGSADRY